MACNRDRVKISGRILNADKQVLHLDEVNVYDSKAADSIVLKGDGKFSFTYGISWAGIQLRLAKDQLIVLFPEPGEHIIRADLKTEFFAKQLKDRLIQKRLPFWSGSWTRPGHPLILSALCLIRQRRIACGLNWMKYTRNPGQSPEEYSISYILTHYKSLSVLYALYQQYSPADMCFINLRICRFFRIVSDSLGKYYPGSKHVTALKAYTDNMIGRYKCRYCPVSPKINFPSWNKAADMAGDTVNLTDFQGKYVLLSFWVAVIKIV